jgi:hypothetical protein
MGIRNQDEQNKTNDSHWQQGHELVWLFRTGRSTCFWWGIPRKFRRNKRRGRMHEFVWSIRFKKRIEWITALKLG